MLDETRTVPRTRARYGPEEESNYDLPQVLRRVGTLYEHCVRAIDNGLRFGVHGLPLMGCGDWNDGMNLVGQHGKGESVWLAFFLYDVLDAVRRTGAAAAATPPSRDVCTVEAAGCAATSRSTAGTAQWYRRAYFDDGTPLGSAANTECQIDSLPQSWSILSGAGTPRTVAAGAWRASIAAWSAAMPG